jgi:RHS repeat-associated protein
VGSVRAVTDVHGNVVRRHDYYAFGEEAAPTAAEDPLRFAGKERDVETGLDYLGARYYASRTGRFTTVDPVMNIEPALVDPQRWNRYAYARNNPLVFIDPDGRDFYRVITPWEQELIRIAGAIRERVATALGADSTGPQHPLGTFGRNVVDSLLATVLPRDNQEYADAANAAIFGMAAPLEGAAARLKAVNLPAWRTVAVDMGEVLSGHTSTGTRYLQSGLKDMFPEGMSANAIENAVRNAYRYGQQVGRKQIDKITGEVRFRIVGPWDRRTIEMWYNETTRTIETAYPK